MFDVRGALTLNIDLPFIIVISIFIFVIVYVIYVYNVTGDILQYSKRTQHNEEENKSDC